MKQPLVLITRTNPGADRLAARLRDMGIRSKCCALLDVEFIASKVTHEGAIQAYILTSATAICGLPSPAKIGDVPVYLVGAQTASQAQEAGYMNCIQGGGNGKKLAKLIAKTRQPEAGKLMWIRGEVADEAMAKALRKSGFLLDQHICYRTQALHELPETIVNALNADEFDVVLFHSRRAAETFRKLSPELGDQTKCLAFSQKIAEVLQDMNFSQIEVCKQPNDQNMIMSLRDIFSLS